MVLGEGAITRFRGDRGLLILFIHKLRDRIRGFGRSAIAVEEERTRSRLKKEERQLGRNWLHRLLHLQIFQHE